MHKDLRCAVWGAVAATPAALHHGLFALPALAGGQHCMARGVASVHL